MKFNLSKNKKGSLYDPITMGAILLTVAITFFLAFYIWTSISTNFKIAAIGSAGEELINQTVDNLTITYSSMDYMVPLVVVAFMIISLVLAFKTGANIVYGFFSIIAWGFAILISIVYQDIFELFINNFPTVASEFPILSFIMTNMKWIVLSWVFLISMVMFTRNKKEDVELTTGLQQVYG